MSEMAPKSSPSNLLTPNAKNMSVPLNVPQTLGSSGSATGNPRNKCALKPGHSLMDWIRLGNSGADLSGTNGVMRPINSDELAIHNTRDNAWMAIRGKVYNVTRYMDFHPGGIDELERGIGKDATKLFEEVHAWVNYEQLLSKCIIGPYQGTVAKIDDDIINSLKQMKTKAKTPLEYFKMPLANKPPVTEVIPRFDWIQKRSDITFYFYTRQFCNPGLLVQRKSASNLMIHISIGDSTHVYKFDLNAPISWPPKAHRISSETGKIEISFAKVKTELWPTYGTYTNGKLVILEAIEYAYAIKENFIFNHNSFKLVLQSQNDSLLHLPVGYHVSITANINEETIKRSYTPVPHKYLPTADQFATVESSELGFLIKTYECGLLTSTLRRMTVGSALKLSLPKGTLNLRSLMLHDRFILLAAGSGLTPMLSLIEHLLLRTTNKIKKLLLMYFNKTEADIWCKVVLDDLQLKDDRFHVQHILSQPNDTWRGATGQISRKLLEPLTKKASKEFSNYACLCGPNAFSQAAADILKSLKMSDANIHIFE